MREAARRIASLCLAAAALSAGGCIVAAVAVGAAATYGAVKYTDNEAYRDFHASLDATWNATLASLRDEGYAVSDSMPHGASEGHVEIGEAKVWVERQPGDFTRVRVRVGTFTTDDHRRQAALILNGIAKRVE
jgi:hypothetical protein